MNIKELSKTNIYIANAKEIRNICVNRGVDVGVAANMFRDEVLKSTEALSEEYKQFTDLCREMTLDEIVRILEE